MKRNKILKELEEGILLRDPERLEKAFAKVERDALSPEQVLDALIAGMEGARKRLKAGECSIPEFLLCIDAFREGVRRLKEARPERGRKDAGVVIGVVQGDVHDLGKNIVAGVLEASGYPVRDLGKDVPRDRFLEAVEENRPALVALSTMMSTPLEAMKDTIHWLRRLHPEVAILVGGAPLDARLAEAIGADGYAEAAADVPEEVERVLALRVRAAPVPAAGE